MSWIKVLYTKHWDGSTSGMDPTFEIVTLMIENDKSKNFDMTRVESVIEKPILPEH